MTTKTASVFTSTDLSQPPISFDQAWDALCLFGAAHPDLETNHNFGMALEYFRQNVSAQVELLGPLQEVRRMCTHPLGPAPASAIDSYAYKEIARIAQIRQDNAHSYRANVKDFLKRIVLPDGDEGGIGARDLYDELLGEIGVEKDRDTAMKIIKRMDDLEDISTMIAKSCKLIKEIHGVVREFEKTDYAMLGMTVTDLFEKPGFAEMVRRVVNGSEGTHPRKRPAKPGTIYFGSTSADGNTGTSGFTSSDDPTRDLFLMTSFLELEQAVRMRGVHIRHKLGAMYLSYAPMEPMDKADLNPHLRQFKHNNDEPGFVFGYDKEGVDRLFSTTSSYHSAYRGAVEEAAIWKKRALESERTVVNVSVKSETPQAAVRASTTQCEDEGCPHYGKDVHCEPKPGGCTASYEGAATPPGWIVYNFDQFVQYGRKVSDRPDIDSMPWSFNFHGNPVTHESGTCYIVTPAGTTNGQRFTTVDLIFASPDGAFSIIKA